MVTVAAGRRVRPFESGVPEKVPNGLRWEVVFAMSRASPRDSSPGSEPPTSIR